MMRIKSIEVYEYINTHIYIYIYICIPDKAMGPRVQGSEFRVSAYHIVWGLKRLRFRMSGFRFRGDEGLASLLSAISSPRPKP